MSERLGPEPHEFQEQVIEAIGEIKAELDTEVTNENIEHKWLKWLGVSTAILSSTAAVAATLGGYYANASSVSQSQASDKLTQFQANSMKRHVDESVIIMLKAQQKPVPNTIKQDLDKLARDRVKIKANATTLQAISQYDLRQHNYFSYAITALQVGISLSAIAVIARNRRIWYLGMGLGTVGIACMIFAAASTSIAAPVLSIHQSAKK